MSDVGLLAGHPIRPLRRAEYDRLVEMGAFADERIELLYGVLVPMSPQKPPHAGPIRRLNASLSAALAGRALVQVQLPLALSDDSEPEPDLSVVAPGRYDDEHPRSALLVIEVAHTSLRLDREVKARLYAEAGIPEYWIVDVEGGAIEVFSDPAEGRYRSTARHGKEASLHLLRFPDVAVRVQDVL